MRFVYQVESLDEKGNVVKGPYAVTIYVEDINDNPPEFDQPKYTGVVRQNSRPGKPFMQVRATDRDDPTTPHAQLTYSILHHFPNPYSEMLFQIDSVSGEISPSKMDKRKQQLGIDSVQSNEKGVKYDIFEKEKLPRLPFSIDEDGIIYVTEPLDREEKETLSKQSVTCKYMSSTSMIRFPSLKNQIYSLEGDMKKWLKINSTTGQIYTASALDREQQDTYTVQVVASELNNAAQKSKTTVKLHLRDVNDNPPRLVMDSPPFFCHPVTGGERAFIQATDDDQQLFYPMFTFSLVDDVNTRNNWEISKVNATYAYLSPKHGNFEEKTYNVPVIIKDNGNPPLERTVNLEVSVCKCSSENSCFIDIEREHSWPSTGQAIGILIAVLLIIGCIVGGVFIHMKYKQKNEKKTQQKDAKDRSELNRLA
ncbi:cadherin-17 [Limosa lapponica baueri]|uniref:Cadherin-17 n=1 Tax=Limosa lapponica baueri TaxID=1758121 RepID=A0A2I0TH37_LIMLA|nr:cadherin-17 [Limosa lapponica baueri]